MLAQVTKTCLDEAAKTDSDTDEQGLKYLNKVVTILSSIEDKDRYLYYLSFILSTRLLDKDLSALKSMEWEKQLIHVIKSKLGSEFSKNLEAMVNDVETCYSRKFEIGEKFKKFSNENLIKDFHVNVLTNCEWMLPSPLELTPPANMQMIQRIYEEIFTNDPTNSNKRLEWNYNLGLIECLFRIKDSIIITECKPYQYMVLQLFNTRDVLSHNDIKQELNLNDYKALGLIMDSLVASPGVLIRNDDGNYTINRDIKIKRRYKLKEAKFEDKSKIKNQVDNERSTAIQCCIVRIMKSNKVMDYMEVCRVTERLLLKFSPTSKAIRKEIDDLIKKENLERDPENFNRLRYIA